MVADVSSLASALEASKELELSLARLYQKCADNWPSDREFWEGLAKQEVTHAECVGKMAELFLKNPMAFGPGTPYSASAVRTFLRYLASIEERLDSHTLLADTMLFIARDIEQTVLETKFASAIKTTDPGYRALAEKLMTETQRHKESLMARIRNLPRSPTGR